MSKELPIILQASDLPEMDPNNFSDQIKSICSEYGLYGNVILYRPSPIIGSQRNKLYLVASRDPRFTSASPPKDFNPEQYFRRNKRSERLVYTDIFVYDLSENNRLDAMEELMEYCKYTEFLTTLYRRYNMDPPQKLRRFEIRQLMDARDKQRRPEMDEIWEQATDALNDFFRKEKKGGRQKQWMDFFRSDKHPDDAGPIEKLQAFHHRNVQEISLEQLMACNGHINTLEMQEHEYRRFSDFMQSAFPDVPYAVSKKIVIDNGTGTLPAEIEAVYGKRITGEEYDRILERSFAAEGWESIIGLQPTYFEVRKIHFISSDEPYIATAFRDSTLRFARRDDLTTIERRGGELRLHLIPADPEEVFMNFVSLAKANHLPFYLDNLGRFETASLAYINVIYSSRDEELMFAILDRIVTETVDNSHVVPDEERPALQEIISNAEHIPPSAHTAIPTHPVKPRGKNSDRT